MKGNYITSDAVIMLQTLQKHFNEFGFRNGEKVSGMFTSFVISLTKIRKRTKKPMFI